MDLHELEILYNIPYTNQAFPFTHKGFTININNLPNYTIGLNTGDLYVDSNGFIKIMS